MMKAIKVEITKFVDDSQPGFVQCRFYDAKDQEHVIIDKVPVVTLENLDAASNYPRPGVIGCMVLEEFMDERGRKIVSVTTEKPWAIDTTEGLTEFEILESQLTDL